MTYPPTASPLGRIDGAETVERAVELRTAAVYPAEILVLQPFEQALVKLLWLLPPSALFGLPDLVSVVQQLGWRTGNGRVAGAKAVRSSLHAIADAGWIRITQGRRANGTREPQRYTVFEDRRNNPVWGGAAERVSVNIAPPSSLREEVTIRLVDNSRVPGHTTWPITAGGSAASGDEEPREQDVSADGAMAPIGADGSSSSPHTPLGGGGTPPPTPPELRTSPTMAAETEAEHPRLQQARALLVDLGDSRSELILGRKDLAKLLPSAVAAFDEGWLPHELTRYLLERPPRGGVAHAGAFLLSRLTNLPLRPPRLSPAPTPNSAHQVSCVHCNRLRDPAQVREGTCYTCFQPCRGCSTPHPPKALDTDLRCRTCCVQSTTGKPQAEPPSRPTCDVHHSVAMVNGVCHICEAFSAVGRRSPSQPTPSRWLEQ